MSLKNLRVVVVATEHGEELVQLLEGLVSEGCRVTLAAPRKEGYQEPRGVRWLEGHPVQWSFCKEYAQAQDLAIYFVSKDPAMFRWPKTHFLSASWSSMLRALERSGISYALTVSHQDFPAWWKSWSQEMLTQGGGPPLKMLWSQENSVLAVTRLLKESLFR